MCYNLDKNNVKEVMLAQFSACGVDAEQAYIISEHLIQASLCGIDTHGISLFKTYLKEFQQGQANIKPDLKWEREMPVSALLDADGANGVYAADLAMKKAIEKAQTTGVGIVVVKNSNHFAAASNYTRLASDKKLIGMCMSNSDALVALIGGKDPFLGTNPIAFSAPGKKSSGFDFDMATSQISYTKLSRSIAIGEPITPGWGADKQGVDLAEQKGVFNALLPLGGYKGQALGFMVQMLTSVLAEDMPFDHNMSHLYTEPFDKPRQVSHLMLVIEPGLFMEYDKYTERVDLLLELAKEHSPEGMISGEKERLSKLQRTCHGIPIYEEDIPWFSGIDRSEGVA